MNLAHAGLLVILTYVAVMFGPTITHSMALVMSLSKKPSFALIRAMATRRLVLATGLVSVVGKVAGPGGRKVEAASHMALASVEATLLIEDAIDVIPSPAEMRCMLQCLLPVVEVPALLACLQILVWVVIF